MEAGREHESTDRDVEVEFLCLLANANPAQVSEFFARHPDGIERLKRVRDAYDAFAPALAAWAARQPSMETGIDPGDSAEGNPSRSGSIDGPDIPGFRLIRRIGEGGMGVVYHAEKLSPRRSVALKVIHVGADSAAKERAMREIQAMASIASPGIVTLYTDEEIGADMVVRPRRACQDRRRPSGLQPGAREGGGPEAFLWSGPGHGAWQPEGRERPRARSDPETVSEAQAFGR